MDETVQYSLPKYKIYKVNYSFLLILLLYIKHFIKNLKKCLTFYGTIQIIWE